MIPAVRALASGLEKLCDRYQFRRLNLFDSAIQNSIFRQRVEETKTQHYEAQSAKIPV